MSDFWSWYHDNGIIPNLWKGFTGQLSAEKQNEQNLAFQREQFDYQKQLNQLQMEREDTAFQRAASDAQVVGINPMALAGGNGASSSPLSSTSFSGSSIQGGSPADGLAVITNLVSGISRLKSDDSERDLLHSQEDKQNLENAINAYDAGFIKDSSGNWIPSSDAKRNQRFWDNINERLKTLETRNNTASTERNERVNKFQDSTGLNDETTTLVKNLRDVEKLLSDGASPEAKKKIHEKISSFIQKLSELDKNANNDAWYYLGGSEKEVQSQSEKDKRTKNNQANYYNRMIRNLYELGNSN